MESLKTGIFEDDEKNIHNVKSTRDKEKKYNQYKNLLFNKRIDELHLVLKVTVMQ